MQPEKKPEVVELDAYRKAQQLKAAEAAKAKAKAPPRERFLGNRPNAGMALIIVVVACAILFILPRLF